MTFKVELRSFKTDDGQEITIRFFASDVRFEHLIRDHLVGNGSKGATEPWERPFSVRFLKKLRQKYSSPSVSLIGDEFFNEVYREVIQVLGNGINFSLNFPIYVEFSQNRERLRGGGSYETSGYYFLSWDGYLVIVRENTVRSAFFNCATMKPVGRNELVSEAWKYLLSLGASWTVDTKGGERYLHSKLQFKSIENWQSIRKVLDQWPKHRPTSV